MTDQSIEYMTVKEVAAVLRKQPLTIYRWLEAGNVFVAVSKVGKNWLIPRHEVVRVISSGRAVLH